VARAAGRLEGTASTCVELAGIVLLISFNLIILFAYFLVSTLILIGF
jgi:hypothetical protein